MSASVPERPYRHLDGERIVETAQRLRVRITERFPTSSLGRIAGEVVVVSGEMVQLSRALGRPIYWVRAFIAASTLALVALVIAALSSLDVVFGRRMGAMDLAQGLESGVNDVIFVSVAVWFLSTLEQRLKRSRALRELHALRALAHIIDMHQLTKDPERLATPEHDTASSPERALDPFELTRYLDYSAELLALLGKLGALLIQELPDPVVLSAVDELQSLTSGLSQKIWQKIDIADRLIRPDA